MNSKIKSQLVGHLVSIYRYPVKSMAAELLESSEVSWFGVAGDRRWAFVREKAQKSGFPWLTIREKNNMNHYLPRFIDEANPEKSNMLIKSPSDKEFEIIDKQLAKELYPQGIRVIKQSRGIFDAFPLSLISTQTIDALGQSIGSKLTVERFRPNFLVNAIGNKPYPEDNWIGKTIRIGSMRMRIDQRDGRCVVTTIDPITSQKNPDVLKHVYTTREGCLGVYASTVSPGVVTVKDDVFLEY